MAGATMAFAGVLPAAPCLLSSSRPCARQPISTSVHMSLHSSAPAAGRRHCCERRPVAARSSLSQPVAAQALSQDVEIPAGHQRYETMIVLRPDLSDEDRDVELAKFEAFLSKEGGSDVNAMVRGRQRLAYPIKKFWDGIFVLYDYTAPRKASQAVQKYLSTPIVGSEMNILRHMTFNR